MAGHRRDQRGVALDLAGAAQRGLGLGEAGAGQLALGHGRPVRGLGGVEPLARQGALLEQDAGAVELEHRVGQRRFGALEPGLGDVDAGRHGVGLRVDLAAVDGRDRLALAHRLADVDEHPLDGARAPAA